MWQTIIKIKQYVESQSAFFNIFLEEGLQFGSSLYVMLVWVRFRKYIFQKPSQVVNKIKKLHPCFQDFLRKQTREAYIDGLCESLKSTGIGLLIEETSTKCRLSDILSEETASSDDEPPQSRCHFSNMEDNDVSSTSQSSYGEVERTSTSLLKRNSKKNRQ